MFPNQPPQRLCALCLTARVQWETAHRADVDRMITAVQQAMEAGQQPPADPAMLLPENLRPGQPGGMPPVQPSVTTLNGTELCPGHLPGQPGARQPLLLAAGPLTTASLSQLAGARQ